MEAREKVRITLPSVLERLNRALPEEDPKHRSDHGAGRWDSLFSESLLDTLHDLPCPYLELSIRIMLLEPRELRKAGYDEIRRIIREQEPPRPSDRLSTVEAASLSTISEQRGIDPRKLTQTLRGDLDWIVMRALEKDRTRRYETANALAADVSRHLADEPIEACPPSQIYRFRKFARRNKTLLGAGTAVALALLAQ